MKRFRPYLNVLIFGTHHHGTAGVNSLYAHLNAFPTVHRVISTHKEDQIQPLIQKNGINTVFLDPSILGYGDEAMNSLYELIAKLRTHFPKAIIVIYTYNAKAFVDKIDEKLKHYLVLDKDKVNYDVGLEFEQILLLCEEWQLRQYEYDVALSFAGEDRLYAEDISKFLIKNKLRVFYDNFERSELLGKNLVTHLYDIYSSKSQFCVMLISNSYINKIWTIHERQAALERLLIEKGRYYVLPVRVDNSKVDGLSSAIGYLDIKEGTSKIAKIISNKIGIVDEGKRLKGKYSIDEARRLAMLQMDEFYKNEH